MAQPIVAGAAAGVPDVMPIYRSRSVNGCEACLLNAVVVHDQMEKFPCAKTHTQSY